MSSKMRSEIHHYYRNFVKGTGKLDENSFSDDVRKNSVWSTSRNNARRRIREEDL